MMIYFTIKTRSIFILSLIILIPFLSSAQQSKPLSPIICFENHKSISTHLPFLSSNLRTQKLSDFKVTYDEGVPQEAINAFEYAVSIWENSLSSSVPIAVKVTWEPLVIGSLASSGATSVYRDFDSKALKNIWYPVPLAEKIAEKGLNESNSPDITVSINQNTSWYFGIDGETPPNLIDFVTIILHELAHGLGIISSADVKDDNGILRESDYPLVYDYFLENFNDVQLTTFTSPSKKLYSEFTSNNLYFHSISSSTVTGEGFPKIYAPSSFKIGSSISHLDEDQYFQGTPNSLMSPEFARGESIHTPGPVLLGMLEDLGWDNHSGEISRQVIVFPNPSKGKVDLQFPSGTTSVSIKMIDVTGREIYTLKKTSVKDRIESFDLSGFSEGVYQLIVSTNYGEYKRRLILLN